MGKECMARLSRRLWGGTSLKTAAEEAKLLLAEKKQSFPHSGAFFKWSCVLTSQRNERIEK